MGQRGVSIFTLGGTISAGGRDGTPRLSGEQVLAGIPAPPGVVLELCDFRRLPSSSLTIEDLAELAERIGKVTSRGDGAVVVQGTDTIEETAFLLDLLCPAEQATVVVTGAMRKPDLPGADGPANLAAAIAVAAAPSCRGLGALVVFADEIHAARHVRKTHTTSVATFASPGLGPLGIVVEGEPRILLTPSRPSVATPLRLRRTVTVGLVTLALGDRGELLDAAGRFDGLVVAGFGAGHVPSWLVEPLEALATAKPVVLASRTGSGPLLRDTYHGPGSEADLGRRGLISAGLLDPPKARLLLHALLADGADRARIDATFAESAR